MNRQDDIRTPFGWTCREWGCIAVLLTLLAACPAIIYGPRFFFTDDSQSGFIPMYLEIGRQIAHGSFPFMTLKSWAGGGIAGEYCYGIFNPIVLGLCFVFYAFFEKFSHAAALFSIFHLVLFGLGVFAICGSLRCRMPEAAFAAIVAATGSWLIYFAAISWLAPMVSLAWFAWTAAALLRLAREPRWLIPATILIALTLASGSPQTDAVLAVFIAIYLLLIRADAGWRACVTLLLAVFAGGLLAAPSLLPLVFDHMYSARPMSFDFILWQWAVPFYAFLSIGLPIFVAPWYTWIGWGIYGFPIVYLDWAVPIILVKAWRDEPQVFKDSEIRLLAWLTVAVAVLCMMPNLSTLRWGFRFLPYFHLFLILLVARILTVFRITGVSGLRWDWRLIATAVGPPVGVAAAAVLICRPDFHGPLAPGKLLLIGLATGLAVALFALTTARRPERRIVMLAAGHALTFLGMVLAYPTNPSLPRWQMPTSRGAPSDGVFAEGNTLFLFRSPLRFHPDSTGEYAHVADRSSWFFPVLSPLYVGGKAINGGTGLFPIAVEQFFLFDDHGNLFNNPLPRLFSRDPSTGVTLADLMRIDSIVAETGSWTRAAESAVPATWQRRILGHGQGTLFRRPPPRHPLPGTLSYLPDGVTAKLVSFSDRAETYELVVSPAYKGRPLVFARPWYPGYHVRLDGKPVEYRLVGDILPEFVLPAGFVGTMDIEYLPDGFLRGCLLAAIAALALLVFGLQQQLGQCVVGMRHVTSLLRERRWTSRS